MSRLQKLKNNPRGRDLLNAFKSSEDRLKWIVREFSGMKYDDTDAPWKKLLLNYEQDIRILSMHRDDALRRQGCSVLLYSLNEDSRRQLWDMFSDSCAAIRILMLERFQSADRHRLYNTLFRIYLNDPVRTVRTAAYRRIKKDFSDLYSINPDALNFEEKVHCLELLNTRSSHDHNIALEMMKDSRKAVVLSAALYLEKAGSLDKLLRKSTLRDREDLERRIRLLQKAADHQVLSFLEKKENLQKRGALFTALSLYESGCTSPLFSWTMEQIFSLPGNSPVNIEMRERALQTVCSRKDPETLFLIRDLLKDGRSSILPYLLEHLPVEGGLIYYPELKNHLQNKDFPFTNSLIKAFSTLPPALCLSELNQIVRSDALDMAVRGRALIILSRFCEDSCILFILENLHLLNTKEMKILSESVRQWNRESLNAEISILFAQYDASLHQRVIALLAASGNRDFIDEIEEKLLSPQAASRTAALKALMELNHTASLMKMKGLLYDPEPSVRAVCASVLIDWDKEDCFQEIESTLQNTEELEEIHKVILDAVKQSSNVRLIPITARLYREGGMLNDYITETLKDKSSFEDIRVLLPLYEKAGAFSRTCLQNLIRLMKEKGESVLLSMLSQDMFSHAVRDILKATGFTDRMIAQSSSPLYRKRKSAVEALCLIATEEACRALLTSARDISSTIRALSLQALIRAEEKEGMISRFSNHENRKIRRLAAWAASRKEKAGIPVKD
ncbi:MAG: hypothetical protein PQJ58_07665 [Spirochaetales bacterium]|nr:hypothetical protein [Spirochaetales bacterium]